jgi:hypothetical protein
MATTPCEATLQRMVDDLSLDARCLAAALEWMEDVDGINASRETLQSLSMALRHVRVSLERLADRIDGLYYHRQGCHANVVAFSQRPAPGGAG